MENEGDPGYFSTTNHTLLTHSVSHSFSHSENDCFVKRE